MRPSTFAISFWFCRCSGLLARTRSFTLTAALRDTVVSSLCRSRASMMISCRNIVVGPAWLCSASSCIGAAACAFSASPPCGGPKRAAKKTTRLRGVQPNGPGVPPSVTPSSTGDGAEPRSPRWRGCTLLHQGRALRSSCGGRSWLRSLVWRKFTCPTRVAPPPLVASQAPGQLSRRRR